MLKESDDEGTHFVRLELLNLNMYTILESDGFEDDTKGLLCCRTVFTSLSYLRKQRSNMERI